MRRQYIPAVDNPPETVYNIRAYRLPGGLFLSYLTYIFPIAAALCVIYMAWRWMPIFADPFEDAREDVPPDEGVETPKRARKALSFSSPEGRITRRDALIALVITLVYAAAAFTGLGRTSSPQSFCKFTERGRYVDIALPEETVVTKIRYFCGLHTGRYSVQLSQDGETWTDAGSLEQSYTEIFKWMDSTEEDYTPGSARYVRLIASDELWLGEIALYGADGERIDASLLEYDAGCAPLFDEQDTVPEEISYLNSTYFDEIYHARTAVEQIEGVYPYEITHPPLGKLIIAAGIQLLGLTPFGWRFAGTLFGALMLPILYSFLKRMLRSTSVAACGTVIFAFDFMHFVQTRIATIDTYAVFFILLMYLFMWRFVSGGKWRYLALSGLFFGLGAASKWTCIYAGAGLAVIWLIYWITRRRREGFWRDFILNCLFCLVFFVALPLAIYYASYYFYGTARGLGGGVGMFFTRDYFDIVWDNQVYMWEYHSDLVAEHPYSSRWYQWLVDARPILYYLERFDDGTKSAFGAFMNPVFCWAGLLAVVANAILAVKDRDGRALFIVTGYLAQLLPWVLVTRLTFAYHYFPCEVFMLLALCNVFTRLRERQPWTANRQMYVFTAACVLLFIAFYPVLTGVRTPTWYTTGFLKWFPSWPF